MIITLSSFVKENLEGDSTGIGGDESMENITVVNLNKLLS